MNISEDTRRVIEFLDEYSGGTLRKKNDLAIILEITANLGDFATANKIIFTGKSVYNLYKKLKKTKGQGLDLLQKQLLRSIDELKNFLAQISEYFDEEIKQRFETTYFPNTNGASANLIDLSYDLSILKDLQMERNHTIKQQENDLQ